MKLTIKRNLKFDYGDLTLMLRKEKIGVLYSNEKEKEFELPENGSKVFWLRFNLLRTSNKILLDGEDQTIEDRRNVHVQVIGFILLAFAFSTFWDVWSFEIFGSDLPIYILVLALGAFLASWKEIRKL